MPPNVVPGRAGPATVAQTRRHPLVRLALGPVVLAVAALAAGVPGVLASPPVGTTGGWLELAPTHDKATADINASYWYVPAIKGGACPPSISFLWDGSTKPVTTVTAPRAWACATKPLVVSFAPPTTETASHRVTACFLSRGVCTTATRSIVNYVIDPTPTLVLSPTKGVDSISFSATYQTGQTACSFSEAQFSWDGTVQGPRVKIDRTTCTAVATFSPVPSPNGTGAHQVRALACTTAGCRYLPAVATFTVLKPTPTATPRPTATPTPAARATASATPTPSPTPTATPSAMPSAHPSSSAAGSPTRPPNASPTATPRPPEAPTPSPVPAPVVPPPPGDSPPPSDFVPALVSSLAAPEPGAIDPAVVATNLWLTLLIVFLFMLTSEIFNSTMDANRDEVHGWWRRVFGGPLRLAGALTVGGSGLSRLAGSGRMASLARVLAVLALLGLIYGFLSPDFGLNQQSAILFLSLVLGLGLLTFVNEASATRLARRRYHATASVQLYGTAVVVAILAVIVSRMMDFTPGLLYGFIASAVIVAPVALARRDDALLVLVPASGLLVISLAAWLLLGPVRAAAAADGAAGPALAESVLGMVMVGGLEGLLFTMLPLTFLDGAAVLRWSRPVWAVVFGTAVFLWWQLLLNHDSAYAAALEQTNVRIVLLTLGVFMLTTGGLWSYFRFRPTPAEIEIPS
jgi:hypothetical protein